MPTLLQRRYVRCPYQHARAYLEEALCELAATGAPRLVKLQMPFNIEDTGGIEKDMLFTFGRGVDPLHFDQPWTVQWTAQGSGLYPDFDGTLTVRADDDFRSSVLELLGTYQIPGAGFDAIAGSRLASATAREFLRTIACDYEGRYDSEEAAKRTTGRAPRLPPPGSTGT